jgi:hypothetical protein
MCSQQLLTVFNTSFMFPQHCHHTLQDTVLSNNGPRELVRFGMPTLRSLIVFAHCLTTVNNSGQVMIKHARVTPFAT